jgi:beta-galactosidase
MRMRTVQIDKNGFVLSGKRKILLMGSLFYFRVPRDEWRDRMRKLKACGYDAIDVYFPWNHHETEKGAWDFEGQKDASAFLTLAEEAGLYVVARPGPYICSEWDGGGLPAYLFCESLKIRDNDPAFIRYTQAWYSRIIPLVSKHSYLKGGCVIAMQIENEYDFYSGVKDREGYISALRDMALSLGADMPLLCCSGQSGLAEAGCMTSGIYPAMNFYPDLWERRFPRFLLGYQQWLAERGFPLLITETNRSHQFLMILLLCGAKLLGPYNQAGGTDFGFTNSINNWGAPLSFQTSDYHFDSMISPSGEINRAEMADALLLSRMIGALGETLAAAQPWALPDGTDVPEDCFLAALKLGDGGYLLGGTCYHEGGTPKTVRLKNGGIVLEPGKCSVCLLDIPLARYGMAGMLKFTDAAPVCLEKQKIVFSSNYPVKIILDEEEICLPVNTAAISRGGIRLKAVSGQAVEPVIPEEPSRTLSAEWFQTPGTINMFRQVPAVPLRGGDWSMEKQGALRGMASYEVTIRNRQAVGIMMTGAADIVSGFLDARQLGTYFPGGHPLYIPLPAGLGGAVFTAVCEIWGHSNFDDCRLPALALSSLRGVRAAAEIMTASPIEVWHRIGTEASAALHLTTLGTWLTADMPSIADYDAEVTLSGDFGLLHFDGLEAALDVFMDGKPLGRADRYRPWLEISGISAGCHILRCTVVKQDFTQSCGNPVLYSGIKLNEGVFRAVSEKVIADACEEAGGHSAPLELPLAIRSGQPAHIYCVLPEKSAELKVSGNGIKATILRGGHICGRLMAGVPGAPQMKGGRPDICCLPHSFGDGIDMVIEALCPDASLSGLAMRTPGTFAP